MAKWLNNLLTPYIQNEHCISSSSEFIDILRTKSSSGIISSIDVESLFTNVPVDATIDIILNNVYNSTMKPLKIKPHLLKQLLQICTKEATFYTPDGKM